MIHVQVLSCNSATRYTSVLDLYHSFSSIYILWGSVVDLLKEYLVRRYPQDSVVVVVLRFVDFYMAKLFIVLDAGRLCLVRV